MSLSVGIVGLPNAGKSTLFNALSGRSLAKVADYPFTTIRPQEAVVAVPDKRLDELSKTIVPEKKTPATIVFVDIAGLVKGSHRGEGLGNEFLSHIAGVDALALVVRAFENDDVSHPLDKISPVDDVEIVKTELILKDLKTVEVLLSSEKDRERIKTLEKIKDYLDRGFFISNFDLTSDEKKKLKKFNFLTEKPIFFVQNVSEGTIGDDTVSVSRNFKNGFISICAKLEAELAEFSEDEREEYLQIYGIDKSGFEKVIKRAYNLLGLITFYTIKGGKEVRAWSVEKGSKAQDAAYKVHTDMGEGFIKAEVINVNELLKYKSWQKAKESGKVNIEGRDYEVKDGDVVEFRFTV